jgi:hypothetical protein
MVGGRQVSSKAGMSALPPKADIRPRNQDVCFGQKRTFAASFDHTASVRPNALNEDAPPVEWPHGCAVVSWVFD